MKHSFEISLNEVTRKKVVDVYGYVACKFGDARFKITRLQLDDGTCLGVEGEHDFSYIVEELELPEEDA